MLTPLDIQNKEFEKGFRGYKEIQVDSFLDEVIADYEFVFKENLELKGKIDMLSEQIKSFGSMETTLQKTLVVAQSTAEEVMQSARDQEESIIGQAERRANTIIESARDQVIDSQKEYETLRKEIIMFRNKYKSLLNAQLDTIDHYGEDNVLGVLGDMKEKDFEFRKQPEVQTQFEIQPEIEPEVQEDQEPEEEQSSAVETQETQEQEAEIEYESEPEYQPEVEYQSESEYELETEQEYEPEVEYEIETEPELESEPEPEYISEYEKAISQIETEENLFSQENPVETEENPFAEQTPVETEEDNIFNQEAPVEHNAFEDSYQEEATEDDSLGFYIDSLENDNENNNDDEIEDLSNNTKKPILD